MASTGSRHARTLLHWLGLGALVGAGCGLASAAFLLALDRATQLRVAHEQLVYLLPIAGLALGAIYARWGTPIRGGNNLVLDTIHDERPPIPLRMGPMVLVGTVLTHLFGGSAGREGTAVQMGASMADAIAHRFRVPSDMRRQLVAAGMAGGFASVFGTPWAGLIFGLEVLTVGRLELRAFVPALVAALVGDRVTRACGVVHTLYPHPEALGLSVLLVLKWLAFALAVAATSIVFIELVHRLKAELERRGPSLPLRMFIGGLVIVALWKIVGTDRYLGLGVPTIVAAFTDTDLPSAAFAWKLLFTAVTIATGFLGGEVTPLFFIGAALGATLSALLGLPLALAAGVGLATVFGVAANTPLALTIMAVELLGTSVLPHVLIVMLLAYLLTGRRSIYSSQRFAWKKPFGGPPPVSPA